MERCNIFLSLELSQCRMAREVGCRNEIALIDNLHPETEEKNQVAATSEDLKTSVSSTH